eukprot:jgi/Chlat1/4013/Chrsp26S03993
MKKSFKERLLAEVNAAERDPAAASAPHDGGDARSTNNNNGSTAQALCIDMLARGHPVAFQDFFRLVRADSEAASASGSRRDSVDADDHHSTNHNHAINPASLPHLRDHLVATEIASRDKKGVYGAYERLAGYFESAEQVSQAIFFYTKCLEGASKEGDMGAQLAASRALGRCRSLQGDLAGAARDHERTLALAEEVREVAGEEEAGRERRGEDAREAAAELARAYAAHAQNLLSHPGNETAATEALDHCLEMAQKAGDAAAVGRAQHELGKVYLRLGQPERALASQQGYLASCRSLHDRAGEGAACAATAACHQALGHPEQALAHLHALLDLARSVELPLRAQANAACALGKLYLAQGHPETAEAHFDRFVALATQVGDRRLVDVARVNLGIVKGRLALNPLLAAVGSGDLDRLLAWKSSRARLAPATSSDSSAVAGGSTAPQPQEEPTVLADWG